MVALMRQIVFLLFLCVDLSYSEGFSGLTTIGCLSDEVLQKFIKVISNTPYFSCVVDGRACQDVIFQESECEGNSGVVFNAVFDGHSPRDREVKIVGSEEKLSLSKLNLVARQLANKNFGKSSIYKNLVNYAPKINLDDEKAVVSAIHSVCKETNNDLTYEHLLSAISSVCEGASKEDLDFGSTLTGIVEFENSDNVILMNVGDSPAFVIGRNGQISMINLHDANNEGEVERMKNARIPVLFSRYYAGCLQVSRDFGPVMFECEPFAPIPEVYSVDKNDIVAVLLMSDGPLDNWNVNPEGKDMTEKEKQIGFITSFIEKLTVDALSSEKSFKGFLQDNQKTKRSGLYDDCAFIIKSYSSQPETNK